MSNQTSPTVNREVLEEAAAWYACLQAQDIDEKTHQAWQQWLSKDLSHRIAWEKVEQISQRFAGISHTPAAKALGTVNSGKRKTVRVLSVALVGLGALGGISQWRPVKTYMQSLTANFHTSVGEVVKLAIAGGGEIWLNTNTAINVDDPEHIQQIHLLHGEVMVDMKQPLYGDQPLILLTAQGKVASAHGKLTVRQADNMTYASVFNGDAMLYPRASALASRRMSAGYQTYFTDSDYGEIVAADSYRESWVQGVFVADNMPLSQFISEIARYYSGYIHYEDTGANLRISGTFPVHDMDKVLDTLQATLPVQIKHVTKWWISVVPTHQV